MSNPSAVVRTAPIAIAPKPPRRQNSYLQDSFTNLDILRGSMPGREITESVGSYTTRSLSPCESCQRSRVRCIVSEDDDSCIPCQASGSDCSLLNSPQPRKRKLNGDFDDPIGKRSSPIRTDIRRRRQHQPSLSSTTGSSSFIEDMANVGGPTLLKRTLGLQNDRYSQYIGPTTDFEPSLINLSPFDPHDESLLARGTLRKVSDDDTFLLLPDFNTPGHEHVLEDVEAIEGLVRPHGRKLVDLYFRIVHPAFPIIQKTVFLEKYERSYREFSPCLLAAVYLFAINWWEHDEDLARLPKPNISDMERLIRTTLADAMYRPKLSTIQAGLLLSQRPEGDQWAPTAQLVAIAQELGLHLDCTNWKIPPWEKGLRKRLAWALYMQDKWGSLVHGRPSHIFSSNWGVQPLTQHDFPDVEWDENDVEEKLEIERGRTLFGQMVQLSQVLAEILDTFFTLQAQQTITNAGGQGTHLILSMAKPIQLKLKEWYASLPATIRMDNSYTTNTVPSNRLSSIGYLHLAYFATEITLHRRIIRSLEATGAAVDQYVQHICRSAAKARLISAMDFVNRLNSSHLRSFWYFASKTNFALIGTFGSLLWATSPGREEADWYRRRLGEYRWTLSVSSKPGEGRGLTNFAMTMLDISTGLLKKLPEKPSMSRSGSVVDMGLGGISSSFGSNGILALGQSAPPTMTFGNFSGLPSADVSNAQSPRSPSADSSDDEMYETFAPTAGMANMAD
ncbi:Transcriptional activator protein DAL81 [Colletotrichum siamense]|uniref:Transcriptional activator protein DAL81 n=1 Tax=Colletotrichum siamense TaxID=690259 RepID=A0A9P5BQY9_COLSI|nr:Transcriptional activator protein DAL81 [Colletotrichum siamense]KAF4846730.1 Transcriptional activator protein DAL81 [Colletotrichum siamense]